MEASSELPTNSLIRRELLAGKLSCFIRRTSEGAKFSASGYLRGKDSVRLLRVPFSSSSSSSSGFGPLFIYTNFVVGLLE